ncbi:UDP-N-acetylmuramate--L-alanine ligase [Thermosipho ferrireducens]|uniref:UDP-N-acetylmuramate--L-alanine ligase n=1 Tax=Thermosipho ferrireducens TaxID=2571116 RepID=A0ABX7S7P6_9BACT|nr:UDP-N-acetylmuramate--L-alanine ligase [Thermosipho ferrireducens]QTA38602.1 UDP-N-acetylmuramate--L-alanine ligase [Thermosipho ferrireducens]
MKVHFLGIGGIGMSAQALHEHFTGNYVTGTDLYNSERVQYLKSKGIVVYNSHNEKNVWDADLVVVTPAISEENPELFEARKRKIDIISRMEHHVRIIKKYTKFGVTGTDGKTTTTSMLAHALIKLEEDPTVFLGSVHSELEHGNYRKGGQKCVFELDESQPGFEKYKSEYLIITNIRGDHIENYKSYKHYLSSFEEARKNSEICVTNADEEIIKGDISFGINRGVFKVISINPDGNKQKVNISTPQGEKKFLLSVPGTHNAVNALAVIALLYKLGYSMEDVLYLFEDYRLPDRRFEISFDDGKITVIDDYSHTPIEVKNLLNTVRAVYKNRRIVVVFQPHRYTRLKRDWKAFAEVLSVADEVYVTEVYGAFEKEDGISAENIAKLISNSHFVSEKDEILELIEPKPAVYLFVGAGDIVEVSNRFRNKLKETVNK